MISEKKADGYEKKKRAPTTQRRVRAQLQRDAKGGSRAGWREWAEGGAVALGAAAGHGAREGCSRRGRQQPPVAPRAVGWLVASRAAWAIGHFGQHNGVAAQRRGSSRRDWCANGRRGQRNNPSA
jgi:hypothetical protein